MKDNRSRSHVLPLLAALLCTTTVACSQSGSDDPFPGSLDDESGDPVTGGRGVNGPLAGRMLLGSEHELDLNSGRTSEFIRTVDTPPGRIERLSLLVPNADASRFHGVYSCGRDSYWMIDTDCVVTFDPNGDEIARFATGRSVHGDARESPDGTMLAFRAWAPEFSAQTLIIADLSGNVLSEGLYEGGDYIRDFVGDVRWLPEGDLVYASVGTDQLVRVTGLPAARPEDDRAIFDRDGTDMPGGIDALGLSGDVSVNPATGEIAFVWQAGEGASSRDDVLYRLDPESGELREFARTRVMKRMRTPVWSPDGDWLAVLAGGDGGTLTDYGDLFPGFESGVVALRADTSETLLIEDELQQGGRDVVFVYSDCEPICGSDGPVQVTQDVGISGWYTRD